MHVCMRGGELERKALLSSTASNPVQRKTGCAGYQLFSLQVI